MCEFFSEWSSSGLRPLSELKPALPIFVVCETGEHSRNGDGGVLPSGTETVVHSHTDEHKCMSCFLQYCAMCTAPIGRGSLTLPYLGRWCGGGQGHMGGQQDSSDWNKKLLR